MPDLIGGSIQASMTEFSTALPLHTGGQARIVGIAAVKRSTLAPDVPTFIEGGVKDFTASSYIGILAPTGTPPAIIAPSTANGAAWMATATMTNWLGSMAGSSWLGGPSVA